MKRLVARPTCGDDPYMYSYANTASSSRKTSNFNKKVRNKSTNHHSFFYRTSNTSSHSGKWELKQVQYSSSIRRTPCHASCKGCVLDCSPHPWMQNNSPTSGKLRQSSLWVSCVVSGCKHFGYTLDILYKRVEVGSDLL